MYDMRNCNICAYWHKTAFAVLYTQIIIIKFIFMLSFVILGTQRWTKLFMFAMYDFSISNHTAVIGQRYHTFNSGQIQLWYFFEVSNTNSLPSNHITIIICLFFYYTFSLHRQFACCFLIFMTTNFCFQIICISLSVSW